MNEPSELLLLCHACVTWYMVGLIWFVQIVHYPLFDANRESFPEFAKRHAERTGWVVAGPMLVEAGTGLALIWLPPPTVPSGMFWLGAGLLAVIWLSTWLLQLPCHMRLAKGFDADVHNRLVRTNWVRTIAWSVRGLLVWAMLEKGS